MKIQRINHVGIRVRDLSVTREFYEHLGFVFVVGPVGPEPVAIMKHPCGIVLNFILNATGEDKHNLLMDHKEKPTGYTHVALEVPDLDATCTELDHLGIPLTEGPIELEDARFVFIRDPDSNVIEFNQPVRPGAFKTMGH